MGQHTVVASLWRSTCASTGLTRMRGVGMTEHHCSGQHAMVTSLYCSIPVVAGNQQSGNDWDW